MGRVFKVGVVVFFAQQWVLWEGTIVFLLQTLLEGRLKLLQKKEDTTGGKTRTSTTTEGAYGQKTGNSCLRASSHSAHSVGKISC